MNNKTFTVYMHKSLFIEDGITKRYIGITCDTVSKRWMYGRGYKGQSVFYNAIQKYGWDSFKHKVLIHGLTKEQACRWERKLIKYYNCLHPYGYNMTAGGDHHVLTIESRLKVSKNNAKYFLGKKLPDKTKERIKNRHLKNQLCV